MSKNKNKKQKVLDTAQPFFSTKFPEGTPEEVFDLFRDILVLVTAEHGVSKDELVLFVDRQLFVDKVAPVWNNGESVVRTSLKKWWLNQLVENLRCEVFNSLYNSKVKTVTDREANTAAETATKTFLDCFKEYTL